MKYSAAILHLGSGTAIFDALGEPFNAFAKPDRQRGQPRRWLNLACSKLSKSW
jgi:hypothetical protein